VDGKDGATGATGPAGPQGPAGTTGQSAKTLTSTGAILLDTITGAGGPTIVPGLWGQITTTANSVVVFTSSGGIVNTGTTPGDHVRIRIRLMVDGAVQEFGSFDLENGNFSNMGRWNFSIATTLAAGTHNVAVDATLIDMHRQASSGAFPRAWVGGAETTDTHGTLTAVVLKQ
jgi:hypothetical protein